MFSGSSTPYKSNDLKKSYLSMTISQLGSSISRTSDSNNKSPARMRFFRDSPKTYKGLEHCVVGDFHPLTPTRVVYVIDGPLSRREQRASPRRIKPINDWRLDVELRLQNDKITKLTDQYHHRITKSNQYL